MKTFHQAVLDGAAPSDRQIALRYLLSGQPAAAALALPGGEELLASLMREAIDAHLVAGVRRNLERLAAGIQRIGPGFDVLFDATDDRGRAWPIVLLRRGGVWTRHDDVMEAFEHAKAIAWGDMVAHGLTPPWARP